MGRLLIEECCPCIEGRAGHFEARLDLGSVDRDMVIALSCPLQKLKVY